MGPREEEAGQLLPSSAPAPSLKALVSAAEWAAWEATARPPSVYDPPQRRGCYAACLPALRSRCCCAGPCLRRTLCGPCCGLRTVRLLAPDDWFAEMLSRASPTCPESLRGIWWMMDNVAAEGVLTLQDGQWETPKLMLKSARYNWTVHAYNCGGNMLTANFWLRGGNHQLEISPNGKWIHIGVLSSGSHWIYVLQPGDILKRPDGTAVEYTPGEDMLRVSYDSMRPGSPISYMYLFRRVAYLDARGRLVKTKTYDSLARAAGGEAGAGALHYIEDAQALTPAPPPSPAPAQAKMRA